MKLLKQFIFLFAIALAITVTSCSKDESEDLRTPEMEKEELNLFISQLLQNDYSLDSTELGVYYRIDTVGAGQTIQEGDTCFIYYTGSFLDGTMFDDSRLNIYNPDGIMQLIFMDTDPTKRFIPGFENALSLMNKGMRLDCIIPSELGYGAYGKYPYIHPYTPLFFTIELVDHKPLVIQ